MSTQSSAITPVKTLPWWQKTFWQIAFLVVIALVCRLYQLNTPLADWHSFRQADTASVAYEYYLQLEAGGKIDLLRPQYLDLGNIQSGQDNLEGWRMVEFPIINATVAVIMQLCRTDNVVLVYRLVNIGLSLLAVAGLYQLTFKLSHRRLTAFLSALCLAILPFSVFYSRAILPEIGLVAGQIFTLLFFFNFLDRKKPAARVTYFFLTLITLSLTLLVKPMAVFIAPLLIFLAVMKYRQQVFKQWPLYLLAILSVLPLLGWRVWIQNFPSGIPASAWLLQGHVKALSPAWWRWLFGERLLKLILGFWGSLVALVALFKPTQQKPFRQLLAFDGFCYTAALSMLLFLLVFASGNVQHDYYQVFMLPTLSLLIGKGVTYLIDQLAPLKKLTSSQWWSMIGLGALMALILGLVLYALGFTNSQQTLGWQLFLILILLAIYAIIYIGWSFFGHRWRWSTKLRQSGQLILTLSLLFGLVINYGFLWSRIRGYYQINHPEIVQAGQAADQLTPADAKIIAPYASDTSFLFQTRRRGWPMGDEIEHKIELGATHYLSVNFDDEARELAQQYTTLIQTPDYILIDLQAPLSTPAQ